jgi:hypothetical protein
MLNQVGFGQGLICICAIRCMVRQASFRVVRLLLAVYQQIQVEFELLGQIHQGVQGIS